jgi:predicted nuclease of predicted toxin-antitoxin system
MWLLDANMDVHLVTVLKEFGVQCETAASRGWKALSNGELVAAAAAAGFCCILTRDQLFAESASRALKLFPQLAVVVITLPQGRWEEYGKRFLKAWAVAPIQPAPGRLVLWPIIPPY